MLALKVLVLRAWPRGSRLLPLLGTSVFALIALTWLTSTGGVLGDRLTGDATTGTPASSPLLCWSPSLIAAIAVAIVTARLGPGTGDDDSGHGGGDRIERVDHSGHGRGRD